LKPGCAAARSQCSRGGIAANGSSSSRRSARSGEFNDWSPPPDQPRDLVGKRAAVLPRQVEIARGLRTDIGSAADRGQRHGSRLGFFHTLTRETRPVTSDAVAGAGRRAMARVTGPHGDRLPLGPPRDEHGQAMIHRAFLGVSEADPTALVEHPPIPAKTDSPLPPRQFRRAPGVEGLQHHVYKLAGETGRVPRHAFFLFRRGAAVPEHRRVAGQRRRRMRVRRRDHEPRPLDPRLGRQSLGDFLHNGCRHAAILDRHNDRRFPVVDHQRARPDRRIHPLMFRRPTAIAGQQHRMRRRDINLGRADRIGRFAGRDGHDEPENSDQRSPSAQRVFQLGRSRY